MTIGVFGTLRAVAQFDIAGVSKAQNVYHFSHTSIESKTDLQVVTAISEYILALMATLTPRMSQSYVLQKVECFQWVTLAWEPIGVATPEWAGLNLAERVPSGIAFMVKAYKERSGYADKKFLAGWTEENLAGDTWNGAGRDAANAYGAAWIAQFIGSEATILLPVSFRAPDGWTRPYTDWEISNTASYQRRRKPGVGLT